MAETDLDNVLIKLEAAATIQQWLKRKQQQHLHRQRQRQQWLLVTVMTATTTTATTPFKTFFRNGSFDFGWFSVCPGKQLRRNNDFE